MKLNIANVVFWIAVFVFFVVTTEPYYLAVAGVRSGLLNLVYWSSFCVAGYAVCVVLKSVSGFIVARTLWGKCAQYTTYSVVSAYISACFPFVVWGAFDRSVADIHTFLALAFYYACAYVAWYCLYFYAQAVRREVAQRAVLTQAAEAAAVARNSVLRYQVRPHFLFNALNALYVLIADRRWAAARGMTQALSQYMERAFVEDRRALVPIGEQVEALQAYLGIEKIRFGDRLRFRAEIPERLAHACAPSLILHPLVENAVKYAVAATADPVDVEIAADRVGDTLVLRVCDSGGAPEPSAAPGLGIGLRNVEARLAGHYGERGLLQCKRLTPKGFVAEIRLPLEFACTPFAA
jgi:sensor histidine kinase YesM